MAIDVSSLWDHSRPEFSEQRFREAMAMGSPDDALLLQTQIARTHGLRKDFARARDVLAAIEEPVKRGSAEAQVRYALEFGRTYASTAHPVAARTPEAMARARSLCARAFEAAQEAHLDALAVDALHMMARMEASTQAEAWQWEGSLRNNIGYAKHLLGAFDEALDTQLRLAQEWAQAGEPDPFVFEELVHLYTATHDAVQAAHWAEALRLARAPP